MVATINSAFNLILSLSPSLQTAIKRETTCPFNLPPLQVEATPLQIPNIGLRISKLITSILGSYGVISACVSISPLVITGVDVPNHTLCLTYTPQSLLWLGCLKS
ncbi:hypothetical protein HD806DRAFT_454662 [Xylariaceae sp. AK1471]|nr:hypothetical protein HD806DRAFT_454662 [Xylariaceae sp. AK1471]